MRLLILVSILMLSGCATLSETECLHGDWFSIGQFDGKYGYKASRLDRHRKACAKVNTYIDVDEYMRGRRDGLNYYCTPQNGFDVGLNGDYYNNVCPPQLERDFLEHYSYGQDIYNVRSEITSVEYKMDQLEEELDDEETSNEERKDIRRELRYLTKELRRLNRDLNYLESKYYHLL